MECYFRNPLSTFEMLKTLKIKLFAIGLAISISACQQSLVKVEYHSYKVDSLKVDSNVLSIVEPYKLSLDSSMNVVIGLNSETINKSRPDGKLNHLLSDMLMQYLSRKGIKTDMCLLNNGGIRLPNLAVGEISKSKIYELMPFDNELVVLKIKGDLLIEALSWSVKSGGDPVSGVKIFYKKQELIKAEIEGKEIDKESYYLLVTSDFVANGGDKYFMLQQAERISIPFILLRDVYIEEISLLFSEGKPVVAREEKNYVELN